MHDDTEASWQSAAKVKGEAAQTCPTHCDPKDCSLPGSSIHGILQARILEWVAISFSRGSSRPRDWTRVSHTADRLFTVWATREALQSADWETKETAPATPAMRGRCWHPSWACMFPVLTFYITVKCPLEVQLLLSQDRLGCLGSFVFPCKLWIFFVLILWKIPIQEHGVSLHLFVSSLISFLSIS